MILTKTTKDENADILCSPVDCSFGSDNDFIVFLNSVKIVILKCWRYYCFLSQVNGSVFSLIEKNNTLF